MAITREQGRHTGASQQVLTYLHEHANIAIPYPEISKAIGARESYTVPNAVGNLISKGIPIEKPMTGFALYRTGPTPAPVPEKPSTTLFEYVGKTANHTIVRGEDEELFVLVPLVEWVKP